LAPGPGELFLHGALVPRALAIMGGMLEKCGCSTPKHEEGSSKIASGSKPAKPKAAVSDTKLLEKLRGVLKKNFKSKKDAFEKLGGQDDAIIDKDEFIGFMKEIEFDGSAEKAFELMDDDNDGFITKEEFKARLCHDDEEGSRRNSARQDNDGSRRNSTRGKSLSVSISPDAIELAELAKLREFLSTKFKNPKQAFVDLDMDGDNNIAQHELVEFLRDKLQYPGDPKAVFLEMDKDGDGHVTWNEFRGRLTETKIQLQRAATKQLENSQATEKKEEKKPKMKKSKSTVK